MARILALTNWYPPHHRGGYEITCRDVMTRMAARGHYVEVLCGDERLPTVIEDVEVLPVRRELRLYWKDGDTSSPGLREQLHIERSNQAALSRAIDEVKPDVVSVWHMAAMSLNLLSTLTARGIPIVYGIGDDWPIFAIQQDPWSRRWQHDPASRALGRLVHRFLGLPTVIPDIGSSGVWCFVSEFTRAAVRDASPWYFSRSPVVPAGIDRTELAGTGLAGNGLAGDSRTPGKPWRWKLAYMGRFDPRKGTDTLVRAMTLLPPETTLTLYGRGGEAERLRLAKLAAALGVASRVSTASLDRNELGDAYRAADCVVFPSEWPEPFGLVPLEAMECETPVVATGVGGSGEFLVNGVNCLLFPPGDEVALAETVTRLGADRDLRSRLRKGGSATAGAYDVERMADGFERWLVASAEGSLDQVETVPQGAVTSTDGDPLLRHQAATDALLWSRPDGVPDENAVKSLYRDLGEGWWEIHASATEHQEPTIPVLSAPETAPVVIGRLAPVYGIVLDAGCGPSPAVSIGVARSGHKTLVAMDIGLGTVRVALAQGRRSGVELLGVVGDVERLPFRAGSFDGLVCDDTIEHLPDDRLGVAELKRVMKPTGLAVLATPNRRNALILKTRLRDRWRGWHRPQSSYFVANSHLREYTWREFTRLVEGDFKVHAKIPIGWEQSRKRRLFTRLLVGPLRELSQIIVIEASPR